MAELDVPLSLWERLRGRLRHYGPLTPWQPCNEHGCWNPMSKPIMPSGWGGKCELCVERMGFEIALSRIAAMTPVFDAKGTRTKEINRIATLALSNPAMQEPDDPPSKGSTGDAA